MAVWVLSTKSLAATHTWTGGVNSFWSVAGNWNGGSPAGDPSPDLLFPNGPAGLVSTDDIPGVLSVNSIQITGTGYTVTGLPGSSIALVGGISGTVGAVVELPISLAPSATHIFNSAGLDVRSVISGTDSAQLEIDNDTALSGDNSYTGSTTIGGRAFLAVNGSQLQSPVTLKTGFLGGVGTTGNATINGPASVDGPIESGVRPGSNQPGTLTVEGDLFLAGGYFGNEFLVRLNGPSFSESDHLQVNGNAMLHQTIAFDFGRWPVLKATLGFAPAIGQTFTILQSTGALTGIFSVMDQGFHDLPDGSAFKIDCLDFRINYTGNSVILTRIASVDPPNNFYTIPPCRLVDTRNFPGPLGGPALSGQSVRVFPVTGNCQIPTSAKSVSANITVTQPVTAGDLRIFPGNVAAPLTSVINFSLGQTRANNVIVGFGCDGLGTVGIQNDATGAVHLIIDVNGYFQ